MNFLFKLNEEKNSVLDVNVCCFGFIDDYFSLIFSIFVQSTNQIQI